MPFSTLHMKGTNIGILAAFILIITFYYFWSDSSPPAWTGRLGLPSSPQTSPPTNVAVIIEDRPLSNLIPLILHFSSVLGPAWPIVLFTFEGKHPDSTPFRRAVDEGRISIRNLPADVHFNQHEDVSDFLTRPWLWEQLAPAGHVLIFQADSILCSNSKARVDDFLQYDFVGAPIIVPADPSFGYGEGYNGGLSLRNRSMTLDIINRFSWRGELEDPNIPYPPCNTHAPCLMFEDQWFYHKMKEIPGARLPTMEAAQKFSVETVWYDTPLGYHQVERWNADKLDKVAQWCPEYSMATTDLLVQHR